MLRHLLKSQIWLSKKFDTFFPDYFNEDGCNYFATRFAKDYLDYNKLVYDIGGGSVPHCSLEEKTKYALTVYGLDIESNELLQAPKGSYDKIIVADLNFYEGNNEADLIICQSVLEHVKDNANSFRSLNSILAKDGILLLFLPSRKALFARLNLLLPENFKMKLLNKINKESEGHQGFKAYYDKATIKEFKQLAQDNGLQVLDCKAFYISSYFNILFPVYFIWKISKFIKYKIWGEAAAETFCMAIKKNN
jgi:SAM-dependent methyltransferase